MNASFFGKTGKVASRLRQFVTAPPFDALAPFRSQPSPFVRALRKTVFFAACLFLGIFYGFWGTVLPTAFIILLIIPFIVLALILVWVLPDGAQPPDGALQKLFLWFTAVTFLWPNYLAIALPGLPWLSMRRIFGLTMAGIFLLALATSKILRRKILDVLNTMPLMFRLVVAFFITQAISIFFADYIVLSYKHWFATQYSWNAVFFLASYLFLKPGLIRSWSNLISIAAVIISIIAIFEQQNKMVLWANHIPPFLQIDGEVIERILKPKFRFGQYRSQAIFSVSLSLAEFLTLSFTLVLHLFMISKKISQKIVLLSAMTFIVAGIAMSGARVGFVGLVAGMAIYFLIWGYRRYRSSRTDITGAALTYGYPALAAAAMALIISVDALRIRILGGGGSQISNDAREMQFEMSPPIIMNSPLFGHGGGRGATALGFYTPGGELTIDTYILSVVLDYGLIGFVFFYGAIAYGIVRIGMISMTEVYEDDSPETEEIGFLFPLAVMLAQFLLIKTVLSQEENHSLLFMIFGAMFALMYRRQKYLDAGARPTPQG